MKKLFIGMLIIAAGGLLLERVLGQQPEERSRIYFDDMYQSVAYKTQSVNPFLDREKTQQEPVEGTIPRGYMPLHYGSSIEESVRAGEELMNPFAADSTAHLARGAAVYQAFCQVCHGAGGAGDGAVVRRGYPPPPSLLTGQSVAMKDGQLYHILTYGYKNMPAYAALVEREDRWHVIAFIRQMQSQAAQPTQEAQHDTLNASF